MSAPVSNHWPRTRDRDERPISREHRIEELALLDAAIKAGRVRKLTPAGSAPASQWVRNGHRFGLGTESP